MAGHATHHTGARVFLSSTSELDEYRDAARDVCERLGLQPIRMETFNATGAGATAASLRRVDEADVYVGIVAWRYGYVEDGHVRSVTAEEHRYAGESGIERLCFLLDPDVDWPPRRTDPDRRRVEEFRAVLDREVRAYVGSVDDFRAKLTSALVEWMRRRAAGPAPDRMQAGGTDPLRSLLVLCEGLPLRVLLDCYRGAVGDWAPVDELTTARRVMEKLADSAVETLDIPPTVRFAFGLEQHPEAGPRSAATGRWAVEAAHRHGLDDDVVEALRSTVRAAPHRSRAEDRLVVRLDESFAGDPADRFLLRVTVARGDAAPVPLPGDDDRAYSISEVRRVVAASVRQWTRDCRTDDLTVEFLVPAELLGEPFDQWPVYEPDDEDATPLGALFGVSVRDLGRADSTPTDTLLDRWGRLHASRGDGRLVHWVPPTLVKGSLLRTKLLDERDWACLAFERFAGDRTAHRLLAVGMDMDAPAIVWVRTSGGAGADDIAGDLRRHLEATPLPQLPSKVLHLRRAAVLCEEPTPHCGRSVGLLWDDPGRRPATAGPLRTPATGGD